MTLVSTTVKPSPPTKLPGSPTVCPKVGPIRKGGGSYAALETYGQCDYGKYKLEESRTRFAHILA